MAGGAIIAIVAAWPVAAEPPPGPWLVGGTGACPVPTDVGRVLATLLPTEGDRSRTNASSPLATVTDLGDDYRVDVAGRSKAYFDPTRNCEQRARIAAAFIALVVAPEEAPPDASASSSPPPQAPPEASPAPAAPPAPERRVAGPSWGTFDLRGVYSFAPGSLTAGGAAVRMSATERVMGSELRLGGHLLCGWLGSSEHDLSGRIGSFSVERWPCALGAAARLFPAGFRLEVDVDAGVALGAVRIAGHGLFHDFASSRLEAGGRVGLAALLHLGRDPVPLAAVVGFDATYLPHAYQLSVA
ncbi:MAG: hypothetical protein FWD17_16010, partial [Polyangiaceae bacterium]|nr:hypothetical protein [Polyangiaceae bacterium]